MQNYATKFIGKKVSVKIDREMGSKHPKHGFVYPVNYGYLENTIAPDGEEIDVYVLGVFEPIKTITGVCIAVLHRTNDNDDKLIVVPDSVKYSNTQIKALIEFQERYFKSIIIRKK